MRPYRLNVASVAESETRSKNSTANKPFGRRFPSVDRWVEVSRSRPQVAESGRVETVRSRSPPLSAVDASMLADQDVRVLWGRERSRWQVSRWSRLRQSLRACWQMTSDRISAVRYCKGGDTIGDQERVKFRQRACAWETTVTANSNEVPAPDAQ